MISSLTICIVKQLNVIIAELIFTSNVCVPHFAFVCVYSLIQLCISLDRIVFTLAIRQSYPG